MNANSSDPRRTSKRLHVLYISYDGLLEPLGYSQVFQYLRLLASDFRFTLITFEKPSDLADQDRRSQMQVRVANAGIEWIPLRYHKRPTILATAFDIAAGIYVALQCLITRRIEIVHARSYVAAVIALALK